MKYLFSALLAICFVSGFSVNALACISKDDCQCFCKVHPDSPLCKDCYRPSFQGFIEKAKSSRPVFAQIQSISRRTN